MIQEQTMLNVAANSSYKPLPMAGALGEEVIVNSEY